MKSMGQGLIIVVRIIETPPPHLKQQDCLQYLHVVCSDPESLDFVP